MSARRKSNRKNQPLVIGICAAILVLLGLVTQIPGVKESLGIQTDAPEPVARVSTAAVSGEYMRVHVLDCGQADAIVVTQGDAAMLIDAGESEHGKVVLDYLAELGVEELSFFVMTHPHADHIGGAKKVLEGVKVHTVILSHAEHTTKLYENTLDAVEASGAEVKPAKPWRCLHARRCGVHNPLAESRQGVRGPERLLGGVPDELRGRRCCSPATWV